VDMFGLNSNTYYSQILNASTYMFLIFLFIKDTENTEKKKNYHGFQNSWEMLLEHQISIEWFVTQVWNKDAKPSGLIPVDSPIPLYVRPETLDSWGAMYS